MIYGSSGTGKSTSIELLDPETTFIINVSKKPLPFKSKGFKIAKTDDYITIMQQMKKAVDAGIKTIVIDDATYLLVNEFMHKISVRGYDKYNEMAQAFWNLIQFSINNMPEDVIIYFMAHKDTDADGFEKMKTIGKLLDDKVTVEGLFTVVLKTVVEDNNYFFSTRNSGHDTVKSPKGMFADALIPNDLSSVEKAIREYYEI